MSSRQDAIAQKLAEIERLQADVEALAAQDLAERERRTTLHVHSTKEGNRQAWNEQLGWSNDDAGASDFLYALGEVSFDVIVNRDTGRYRIIEARSGDVRLVPADAAGSPLAEADYETLREVFHHEGVANGILSYAGGRELWQRVSEVGRRVEAHCQRDGS